MDELELGEGDPETPEDDEEKLPGEEKKDEDEEGFGFSEREIE